MKTINDDTQVGYDNEGYDVLAEELAIWAYQQLKAAPNLYKVLKETSRFLNEELPYINGDLADQIEELQITIEQALGEAEGN